MTTQRTAHDRMMALAEERARTSGRTREQEYDELFRTRHDLRRALAEERLAARAPAPPEDGGREVVGFYHEALAADLRRADPTLSEARAFVLALDRLPAGLRRVLAGGR